MPSKASKHVHTTIWMCCILIYTYTCINILTQWIMTSDTVLRKIYLSLYLKGYVWEGVGDRTETQHIDPHTYGYQRCVFLVLLMLNRRPGDSAFCWLSLPHLVINPSDLQLTGGPEGLFCRVVVFSTTSCLRLLWSPTQSGVPRAPSAG